MNNWHWFNRVCTVRKLQLETEKNAFCAVAKLPLLIMRTRNPLPNKFAVIEEGGQKTIFFFVWCIGFCLSLVNCYKKVICLNICLENLSVYKQDIFFVYFTALKFDFGVSEYGFRVFSQWLSGKESSYNAGEAIPESGKSPRGQHSNRF